MPVPGFNRPGDGGGGLKLGDKLNFVNNLVAKNQPATMADSVQTLINKVANLGYVGSKRWASGATSVSGINRFVVSGLSFTPSYVMAIFGVYSYMVYNKDYSTSTFMEVSASNNAFTRSIDGTTYYFKQGGFAVDLSNGGGTVTGTIYWFASE